MTTAQKTLLMFGLGVWLCCGQDLKTLQPQGYVSDFAHVLDARSLARIEEYCGQVERATGAQMALVTINTLGDTSIEDFSNELFHKWGVGKKGQDEGVMLLLVVNDHKDRIEVGYGLESVLPDGFAGQTLREIRPQLRQGDYWGAILIAAEVMGDAIAKAKGVTLESHLLEVPVERRRPSHGGGYAGLLIFVGFAILIALMSRLGRGRRFNGGVYGPRYGGGGDGLLAGMILGNVLSGSGRNEPWGGGGFGGFDSGSGGGFGGFGGGDSGGGGASGSW